MAESRMAMQSGDLIKYQTYANALVKLNNATNTLLHCGANEEAIKFILQGTNMLFEELTTLMQGINNSTFFSDLMEDLELPQQEAPEEKKPTPTPPREEGDRDQAT